MINRTSSLIWIQTVLNYDQLWSCASTKERKGKKCIFEKKSASRNHCCDGHYNRRLQAFNLLKPQLHSHNSGHDSPPVILILAKWKKKIYHQYGVSRCSYDDCTIHLRIHYDSWRQCYDSPPLSYKCSRCVHDAIGYRQVVPRPPPRTVFVINQGKSAWIRVSVKPPFTLNAHKWPGIQLQYHYEWFQFP